MFDYCITTDNITLHVAGLIVGDEVLVINSKVVSDLDMVVVETMLPRG